MMEKLLADNRTLIMGILNITPDSFADGGKYFTLESALRHADQMVEEGADIIDVGGESTRPGADPVPLEEEERRVLPAVEVIAKQFDIPISVDTYKSQLAKKALDSGAQIVNDITGLRSDSAMVDVVASHDAYVVIMHMKGTPKDMQMNPHYNDVLGELVAFFHDRTNFGVDHGISKERIILDPGIGFGKRLSDNFVILGSLEKIVELGYPVLVGPSRKSFIGLTLDLPPDERIEGTAASVTAAILSGAKMVRVHDVKEMRRVAVIADAIRMQRAAA